MEDATIIGLYWARDEGAIAASDEKYGWLCRNLSQNILDSREDAEKRGNGLAVLLDELEECLPAVPSAEEISEAQETARAIDRWLDTLSPVDRTAFLRRYWYGQRVDRIAAQAGCSPNSMAKRLSRLRDGLRKALEQEGIVV